MRKCVGVRHGCGTVSAVAQSRDERIRQMHASGLGYKAIAKRVGISATSVRRVVIPGYRERLRRQSNAAKRRRTGTCERCGGETRYHGRKGQQIARLCANCGSAAGGEMQREATRGKGRVQVATLAFLTEPHRFSEIRDHLGITKGHTGAHLNRMLAQGSIVRIGRGVYVAAESRAREPEAVSPTRRAES